MSVSKRSAMGSVPRNVVLLVLLALLVALVPAGGASADAPHTDFPGAVGDIVEREGDGLVPTLRFRGENRFDTAHLIGEDTFTDPDTVLIARGNLFPDSLSGNYLAGQLGVPLLLTPTESLTAVTQHALENLDPDDVILLGSTEAISGDVETQLSGQGFDVSRIGGIDRYETAADIATRSGNTVGELETDTPTAIVASGDNFPDALVSGAISYDQAFPLLLTYQDHLPQVTIDALQTLGIEHVIVPGGTVPVGEEVRDELEAMGIALTELSGPTRVDTALDIAQFAIDTFGWDFSTLAFARGDDFADALTIGPRQGSREDILLLTNTPTNVGANNLNFLTARACQIDRIDFAGGYVAIADSAEGEIREAATANGACDITLTPESDTNLVGEPHTVTATVTNNAGTPVESVTVTFEVETSAAIPTETDTPLIPETSLATPDPETGTAVTDENGEATFTFTSQTPGTVTVTGCITTETAGVVCNEATKTFLLPDDLVLETVTALTGAEEVTDEGVPNQGDLDGLGSVTLFVSESEGTICAAVQVVDIGLPATGAHIHEAPAGSNGPIVAPFISPGADGTSFSCVDDDDLLTDFLATPTDYYFNVHNDDFPDGALRGQFGSP